MSDPTCQLLYKEWGTLLYKENKTSPCTPTQRSLAKEMAPESSGGSDKLTEGVKHYSALSLPCKENFKKSHQAKIVQT